MSDTVTTATATVIAVAVTGGFSWVTQRSAARAAERAKVTESRTEQEEAAFERAKEFYTDVIDRQETDLGNVRTELRDVTARARAAEERAEAAEVRARAAEQRATEAEARAAATEHRLLRIEADLMAAQALLRLHYPDET